MEIYKFEVWFNYTDKIIEEVEALDVEQAYQMMYEMYPEADIISI